ncbi:MAG TPA: hypothetical protein PKD70_11290 [Saprospiraceae bacterium]|nr:hypothetical protein [Saprospiraceae bacterium]HMP14456.1 hypothetical protein [Saprospiraceae bacterium]
MLLFNQKQSKPYRTSAGFHIRPAARHQYGWEQTDAKNETNLAAIQSLNN